jgi:hypothetical protein
MFRLELYHEQRLFILNVQQVGPKMAPMKKEWLVFMLKVNSLILVSTVLPSVGVMADANNHGVGDACNIFTFLCYGGIPKLTRDKVPNRSTCVLDAANRDLVTGVIDP